MFKRSASKYVTQDNFQDEEDDNDRFEESRQASSEELSRRKILKPRSRTGAGISATGNVQKTNPFSALSKSSGYDVGNNLYPSISTVGAPSSASSASSVAASAASSDDTATTASMIKALNDNFVSALTLTSKKAPLGDYSEFCEKYIKYFKQIKDGSVSVASDKQMAFGKIDGDSGEGKRLEGKRARTGSNLLMGQTVKFGENKEVEHKKEAQDSKKEAQENKEKTKGPVFVFNAEKGSNSPPVFKFGASASASTSAKPLSGPSFTVPAANAAKKPVDTPFTWGKKLVGEKEEDKKEEQKKGFSFSFGTNKTPSLSSSSSSSSAPAANTTSTTTSVPAFSFKPSGSSGFSFGASKDNKDSVKDTKDASKPAFSFGNSTAPKSGFSFGKFSQPEKKEETVDGKKEEKKEEEKKGEVKPFSFSFNKTSDASTKPAETSTSTKAPKPVFSFGQKDTSKTDGDKTESQKPLFPKFPDSKTAAFSKPAFSFGSSSTTSSTPAFSLGKTNFNFTKKEDGKQDEPKNEDAKKDELSKEVGQQKPLAGTNDEEVFAGEENEKVKYSKRAKLLQIEKGAYVTKGLGMLRILENQDTKKCRLVLRSEGSNNVLFNQYILKKLKCEIAGKNTLKVPYIEDGKMEVYFIRVKDGDELLKAIEEHGQ